MHQKMDVIIFPIAFNKLSFEICADLCKDVAQVTNGWFRQHVTTVFCDKDQMNMQHVNNMSACAIFHVYNP